MNYAKGTWMEELASWRTVVQLNLLRNVHVILDLLNSEMGGPIDPSSVDSDDETPIPVIDERLPPLRFNEKHGVLQIKLTPLRSVQKDLEERLGASSFEETASRPSGSPSKGKFKSQEIFVRSSGWKSHLRVGRRSGDRQEGGLRTSSEMEARRATEVIASCAEDMKALWEDETVQEMLRRRRVRLDDAPGLYV